MEHTLPPLPYAKDALSPVISAETIDYHHGKHHQAYVTNLNNLVPGTRYENLSLEEVVKASHGQLSEKPVFNNSAQDDTTDETVYTASNQNPGRTMQPFNPFTTQPIEGVHYELSPNFGQPLEADDYQNPRKWYFGFGFRF